MGVLCSVDGQKLPKCSHSNRVKTENGVLLSAKDALGICSFCLSVFLLFSVTVFFLLFFLSVYISLSLSACLSLSGCASAACLPVCL